MTSCTSPSRGGYPLRGDAVSAQYHLHDSMKLLHGVAGPLVNQSDAETEVQQHQLETAAVPLVIDVESLHPNGSAKGHLGAVSSAFFLRWVERWRRRLRAIMPLFVAPSRALEVCC